MLYLASKSPRRRQLLQSIGVEFETLSANIDETWNGSETAEDYVTRLALEKARAAREQVQGEHMVLAADTEVVLDERVLGKPSSHDDAMQMLQSLSGRCHRVITAVVLLGSTVSQRLSVNKVCFDTISRQQCESYCQSGEPYDKAGAYGIQGGAAVFLRRLEGSYSSVMGLPLKETAELVGVNWKS